MDEELKSILRQEITKLSGYYYMKRDIPSYICMITRPRARRKARLIRSGSVAGAFALAAALLGVAGGGFSLQGGTFPSTGGPVDEGAGPSMGLFHILVKSTYWPMMNGSGGPSGHNGNYYGYLQSTHTFSSPLLSDRATQIGMSQTHCLDTGNASLYNDTPGVACSVAQAVTASYSEDLIWSLHHNTPAGFPDTGNYNEVFICMMNLQLTAYSNCWVIPGTGGPQPYDSSAPMVFAGPAHYPTIHKSIGRMVSGTPSSHCVLGGSTQDYTTLYPARSFFNIYINAWIPYGPGTDVPSGGFYLYNDPNDALYGPEPLTVENTDVTDLPPQPIYYHNQFLFARHVKFLNDGHDQSGNITWHAGDTFGSLTLAGHELGVQCGTKDDSAVSNFVRMVVGPQGQATTEPPTLWAFPNSLFPSTGVTYSSKAGTSFDGASIDQIVFTNTGYGDIYLRSLIHGGFANPIPLPSASSTYSAASSSLSCEVSVNGTNFFSATGSGPLQLGITKVGPSGNATVYDTVLSFMNVVSHNSAPNGPFLLRASLTQSSKGQHGVMQTANGSYIASYLDANYELSDDSGDTWYPADRPIRLYVSEPACGEPGQGVHMKRSGSSLIFTWANANYRLQGSTNLTSPVWLPIAGTSPLTVSAPIYLHYFRLVCP